MADNTDDLDSTNVVFEIEEKLRAPTPYEKKLRTEAANNRRALEEAKVSHAAELQSIRDAAEAKMSETTTAAERRIIKAELKASALKAGLHDLDALAMVKTDSLKIAENGDVEGADELFAELKKSKPYLFGDFSTSSTKTAPKTEAAREFDYRTASPAERSAWQRKMGLSR